MAVAQQVTALMAKVAFLMSRLEMTEQARRSDREREADKGREQLLKFTLELEELNADLQVRRGERHTQPHMQGLARAATLLKGVAWLPSALIHCARLSVQAHSVRRDGRGRPADGSDSREEEEAAGADCDGEGGYSLYLPGGFERAAGSAHEEDTASQQEEGQAGVMMSAAEAARKAAATTAINKELQVRRYILSERAAQITGSCGRTTHSVDGSLRRFSGLTLCLACRPRSHPPAAKGPHPPP